MLITPFVFDNSKNVLQSYYIFCKYARKASIILKNALAMFRYFRWKVEKVLRVLSAPAVLLER